MIKQISYTTFTILAISNIFDEKFHSAVSKAIYHLMESRDISQNGIKTTGNKTISRGISNNYNAFSIKSSVKRESHAQLPHIILPHIHRARLRSP